MLSIPLMFLPLMVSQCDLVPVDLCHTAATICEVNNAVDPPVCTQSRCFQKSTAECPVVNGLCEMRNDVFGNPFCSNTYKRLACTARAEKCGSGDFAHCEMKIDVQQCVLKNYTALCSARTSSPSHCTEFGGCDVSLTEDKCVVGICPLIDGQSACEAALHCWWDNTSYTCQHKTQCEGRPWSLCGFHEGQSNCGWSGNSCVSCSNATSPDACKAVAGCQWYQSQCMSLRHRCARYNPLTCMTDSLCTWKGSECVLWSEEPIECTNLAMVTCAPPYCRSQGLGCVWRETATACNTEDAFRCASFPQCWWDTTSNSCEPVADTCSVRSGSSSCLQTKDAAGKACTWFENSEHCVGNIRLNCSASLTEAQCGEAGRCGWWNNQCIPLSGCSALPKTLCGSVSALATGFACRWEESTSSCQIAERFCSTLDLKGPTACGGSPCEHVSNTHRDKRIKNHFPNGWMGMDMRFGFDEIDADTGNLLCPYVHGVACPVCQPPYVIDPYARINCFAEGGAASLSGPICKLPEEICQGNFKECAPPPPLVSKPSSAPMAVVPAFVVVVLMVISALL